MGPILKLLGARPLSDRIMQIILFNNTIFTADISSITIIMLYPKPIKVQRKILFWKYTKIIDSEVLGQKFIFINSKIPPQEARTWEIKLYRPYIRNREYIIEVEGDLILGKTSGGIVPVITPSGVSMGYSGSREVRRGFKETFRILL